MEFALMLMMLGHDGCFQQRQVVIQPQPTYANVYYFVGAPLRQAAVAEKTLRDDPQYQEFLRFKAWQESQAQANQASNERTAPSSSPIAAHCGRCHGGASPKGGFFLDGQGVSASDITKSLRKVAAGEMPPNSELTPQEKGELMQALLNAEVQQ